MDHEFIGPDGELTDAGIDWTIDFEVPVGTSREDHFASVTNGMPDFVVEKLKEALEVSDQNFVTAFYKE